MYYICFNIFIYLCFILLLGKNVLLDFVLYNVYFSSFTLANMSSSYIDQLSAPRLGTDGAAQTPSSILQHNENVDFVVRNEVSYDQHSDIDYIRTQQISTDNNLQDFFSRPVRIHDGSWEVNTDYYAEFNPWTLFFQDARVANKLCNFKLLAAKLHVKVLINGNSFFFGRLLCSYAPYAAYTQYSINSINNYDYMILSQLPHCYMSPSQSTGCEMEIPMLSHHNALDIPTRSWDRLGNIYMKSIGPLNTMNGSTTPVNVTVFAWATNVTYGGLTSVDPSSLSPQSDEYLVKPVSRLASAIADASLYFAHVPFIGKFARATNIGASAVSAIANLFGFSKPVILDTTVVVRHAKNNLAVTNAQDDAHKLTLDIKQEVTIDPRVVGATPHDEMSILNLAMKPSFVTVFNWGVSQPPDSLIFNMVVDPCMTSSYLPDNGSFLLTPSAMVSFPFKFWRGSIKYKFDVICSPFHKGRLRILHEPTGLLTSDDEFNVNRSMIVDISDGSTFEFCVPWSQHHTFRQHAPFGCYGNSLYNDEGNCTFPYFDRCGNGSISVLVLNTLTNSTPGFGEIVTIIVTQSVCSDFEVAVPSYHDLSFMRYTADPNWTSSVVPTPEISTWDYDPQSLEMVSSTVPDVPSNDHADLIYFGESVRSIRSLLKRYCLHEIIPLADTLEPPAPQRTIAVINRPIFPIDGGYLSSSINTVMPVYSVASGKYCFANMTYLNYFSGFFLGWRGAIRYLFDTSEIQCCTVSKQVSRSTQNPYPSNSYYHPANICSICNPTPGTALNALFNYAGFGSIANGQSGSAISTNNVDPITTVELPYYSHYRFIPGRFLSPFSGDGPTPLNPAGSFQVTISAGPDLPTSGNLKTWVSTGEDFSFQFFTGTPVLYYQTFSPV